MINILHVAFCKDYVTYPSTEPVRSFHIARRTLKRMVALACTAALLRAQQPPVRKSVDFRNFTFAFPSGELNAVPSKLTWMSLKVEGTVTLLNGRFDFDKTNPSAGPSVILDRVLYGYLTSATQLDAVVVLGYHTGGKANWQYVYVFGLKSDEPKLVGWFRAGSRADFGLYGVKAGNRTLTVDLLDRWPLSSALSR